MQREKLSCSQQADQKRGKKWWCWEKEKPSMSRARREKRKKWAWLWATEIRAIARRQKGPENRKTHRFWKQLRRLPGKQNPWVWVAAAKTDETRVLCSPKQPVQQALLRWRQLERSWES